MESAIVVHRGVNLEEILSAALHARLMSMHDLLDALRLELRRQGVATAIAKGKGAIWRYLLGAVCTVRTVQQVAVNNCPPPFVYHIPGVKPPRLCVQMLSLIVTSPVHWTLSNTTPGEGWQETLAQNIHCLS